MLYYDHDIYSLLYAEKSRMLGITSFTILSTFKLASAVSN